mmetsp:Transcript_6184/g.14798  ORF Transcript_6184/g.14798 Transcript_6184/m.14798 type:complete len:549 (-) Transcript_6184:1064-2710(-)
MRKSSKPSDDLRDDDQPISTRALRASVRNRQQGKYQRENADNTSNKLHRTSTQKNPSYSSIVPHNSGDIDCLPMPPSHPTHSTTPPIVPRLNLGGPSATAPTSNTPPIVPRLNLGGALNGSPAAPTPPIIPKLNLNKSSSVPTPSEDSPSELQQAQAEIQGLKCENMRLLLDKSSAHQRMQEVCQERDSLQAELARLKKDHSKAVLEQKSLAEELAQCQQQLSEVAASSKVASTTSEIYTRALSQTVALRMSHAGEMEELQQVMEEKDEAVHMLEELVMKLQEEMQALQGSKEQVQVVQQMLEGATSEREQLVEEIEEVRREWAVALEENKSLQQELEEKVQAEGRLGREKQELMGQLVQMKAALEEHATPQPDEQHSAVSSSAVPHDLPAALSLLQRRSVQNETLRQQKRELEDELDGALAELQMLKDQVKALEHKQLGKLQRQQQGKGKRMLGCALRCVARLGVYSVVAVATVAGTHSQQGRGLVDRLTAQGGRAQQVSTSAAAAGSPHPEQEGPSTSSTDRKMERKSPGPHFSDDSPRRRLSRYY